jgi:putative ATP-dependent endonuclease of OLD family
MIITKLITKNYRSLENVEIVQQTQENSTEGKEARSKIKIKILEQFEAENAKNNLDIFKDFYPIVKKLNKIFT